MYKYLHANKQQAGYTTLLVLEPQHDHYYCKLVASRKPDLYAQLEDCKQIWHGFIKNLYINHEETVFKFYYYKDDPEQQIGIDAIHLGPGKHSLPDYLNKDQKIECLGYIVRLDKNHKLKYLPYNWID